MTSVAAELAPQRLGLVEKFALISRSSQSRLAF